MDWPILGSLSEEDRRRVLAAARRRRFARKEVVFHEGDAGASLHLIVKGRLGVRVTTPLGDTATLVVLGPGDFFGELALLSAEETRTATVVALEPAETLTVHRDQFEELRRDHPAVERLLNETLATQVRRLTAHLLEALYVPADKRVLRHLLGLVALYGDGKPGTVVPLTQDDLAEMAGTTRPTVNRLLRSFEETGAVDLRRGEIEVIDPDALARKAR
jgi:CRP-like cAMP-binding protein